MNGKKKGFTLIELLVVVLIIGILAAIALPQYQKAVLKSRYTTLMPIAKGIAEGNEAYFMEHGTYAEDPTELPIKGQENYPDGMELAVVDDATKGLSYVMATRPGLMPNNKYIVFQKHSDQFPDATICEATSDKLATWLCQDALKGQKVAGSVSGSGWKAYLISGEKGNSKFVPTGAEQQAACEADANCTASTNAEGDVTTSTCTTNASGNQECSTVTYDEYGDQLARKDSECGTISYRDGGGLTSGSGCKTTVYDENGIGTTTNAVCNASVSVAGDGGCVTNHRGTYNSITNVYDPPYEITYDENGEMVGKKVCTYFAGNNCNAAERYNYNEDGSFQVKMLGCGGQIAGNFDCVAKGNVTIQDFVYNNQGKQTSQRYCYRNNTVSSQCISYSDGEDYTYDSHNNITSSRNCSNGSIPLEGKCSSYEYGTEYTNSYDAQGNLSYIARSCNAYSDGVCSSQGSISFSRQPIYEGGVYVGYRVATEDVGGTIYYYDTEGNEIDAEYSCPNGVDWENARCNP